MRRVGAAAIAISRETRTDAEGRYTFNAYSQEAYILAVDDAKWAASYLSGLILKAGQPIEDANIVLGSPTRLHGRVSLESDGQPDRDGYLKSEHQRRADPRRDSGRRGSLSTRDVVAPAAQDGPRRPL